MQPLARRSLYIVLVSVIFPAFAHAQTPLSGGRRLQSSHATGCQTVANTYTNLGSGSDSACATISATLQSSYVEYTPFCAAVTTALTDAVNAASTCAALGTALDDVCTAIDSCSFTRYASCMIPANQYAKISSSGDSSCAAAAPATATAYVSLSCTAITTAMTDAISAATTCAALASAMTTVCTAVDSCVAPPSPPPVPPQLPPVPPARPPPSPPTRTQSFVMKNYFLSDDGESYNPYMQVSGYGIRHCASKCSNIPRSSAPQALFSSCTYPNLDLSRACRQEQDRQQWPLLHLHGLCQDAVGWPPQQVPLHG